MMTLSAVTLTTVLCAGLTLANAVCWSSIIDAYGFGGAPHRLERLSECQSTCVRNVSCVAVDWEPDHPQGDTCWILKNARFARTSRKGFIIHYVLDRHCHQTLFTVSISTATSTNVPTNNVSTTPERTAALPTTTTEAPPMVSSTKRKKNEDHLPFILILSLGIGIAAVICMSTLLICCRCRSCQMYGKCRITADQQHPDEGATDNNFQPMNVMTNRQATTTYEPLGVNRQRPVNYQQLPPQTGHEHGYYNVGSSANANDIGPYEELDINRQPSPVYDQLDNR